MKSLIFLLLISVTIFSCTSKSKHIKEIECVVDKCEMIEKKSVHDDINPNKYRVHTDCGNFIGYKSYEIGEKVMLRYVNYH
jgi:hypothetical protein